MISVDNGELMHRGSWCRGSTEEMGTLNQDSVWEADGEMSVKGKRAGLSIPALASALSYLLGGDDSGVSQRVLEALRRGYL